MEQISSQLCPRCHQATVTEGSFCSVCNTRTETIADHAGNDPFEDADKTVRANARLSSRLYLKAVEQASPESPAPEALQPDTTSDLQMPVHFKKHFNKKSGLRIISGITIVLLLFLLITEATGYNSTSQAHQQADQAKEQLDTQLWHIQGMGIPATSLSSLFRREQQIDNVSGIATTLHNGLVAAEYQSQAQQYQALETLIPGIVANATTQLQSQAQQDIQNLQTAVARVGTLGTGNLQIFIGHLSQDQLSFATAHKAAEYAAISTDVHTSISGLNEMAGAFQQLTDLAQAINNMKQAHQNVTSVQAAYQNDLQLFRSATQMSDFQTLSAQITAQDQQLIAASIQAFPYISATRLNEFETQISQLKQYGGDSKGSQIRLSADQVSAVRANSAADDLAFFRTIDADIAALHAPLMRSQAHYLLHQFHNEVQMWGKTHLYYDNYDGKNYMLDNGYMNAGVGALLDTDLANAQTTPDFENVVAETNNALFNLHMFESDYKDQTPYNHVHTSDLQLIKHYALQKRQVLVVSLAEQVMRVYQNGKLVQTFIVTTGRQELPSIPGVWSVLARRSPVIFQSGEPKDSPYWFPDTPIQYAILYHLGGYFIHDAPWREAFGPGTQFPHGDPSGTSAYNFDGSHGCINLNESDATWIYTHTNWNTSTVIY